MMSLICITNGFAVFFPGHWNTATFITAYISFPIFIVLYMGHRFWTKAKQWYKPIHEIDVFSGLEEVEETTAKDTGRQPGNLWERFSYWLC